MNSDESAGTAPGLLVPFLKRRRIVHAVRNCALLPGPAPIWESGWVGVLPTVVCADDSSAWPCSVGVLVKWVAFLGALFTGQPLGLICPTLRCSLEKAVLRCRRPGRTISVLAVPCGPGIDMRLSWRFIGCFGESFVWLSAGSC